MAWKRRPNFQKFYAEDYEQFMETVRLWLQEAKEAGGYPSDLLFQYVMDALLEDVCSSEIINPFMGKECSGPAPAPFPDYFVDQEGQLRSAYTGEEAEVELAKAKLYLRPWSLAKTARNLCMLRQRDFQYQSLNHRAQYYPEINLCYVYNGNHSINAGRYFRTGTIKAQVCRLESMFLHCGTDGVKWYDVHTQRKLGPVSDFRFALVYSLAQMRWTLKIG